MSAFTTSFTGVRVVSKTAVAKKSVSTKAVASMDNVKKVRRRRARRDRSIGFYSIRSIDRLDSIAGDGTIARVTTKTRGLVRVMRAMDV
jgi:hypothetical protein